MQVTDVLKEKFTNGHAAKRDLRSAEGLSNEFKSFVSDIEGLIKRSTSLQGSDLDRAQQEISERVSQAKTYFDEKSDNLIERARTNATQATDYARTHPWGVAGVTLAFGLICGLIITGRKK